MSGSTLHVTATGGGAGVTITSVQRGPVLGAPSSGTSGYELLAVGADGRTLASTEMSPVAFHVEMRPSRPTLEGDVPAGAAVASLQIVAPDGSIVARQERPAAPSGLAVLSPRRGARVSCARSGCSVTVSWRVSDPAGTPLDAVVGYSADAGRTWNTVFVGQVGDGISHARVPVGLLSRSAHARVRVTVSDGFDDLTGLSEPFIGDGAPPTIQLLSPVPGQRTADDATINLLAQAYDDAGNRLRGSRLRWYAGRKLLGSGEAITASALPPGAERITLVARDRYGRASSAGVQIRLNPVPPQFLELRAPRRIGRRQQRVVIRVASSLPAVLSIRVPGEPTIRRALGRKQVSVRVPVRRGRRPAVLRLALLAYGRASHTSLTLKR